MPRGNDGDRTLAEVRAELEQNLPAGTDCPCCGQHAQLRRRALTNVSARAVIALWRVHREDFGHLPTVIRDHLALQAHQGGYTNLAVHWRLMEHETRVRGPLGRGGYWRVTPHGVAWILGRAAVPKYAHIFNGECRRLDGPQVTVVDVLTGEFDLAALLGPPSSDHGEPVPLFDLPTTHASHQRAA